MIQILVSLAILGLWALTSLLSREAQPLPPRPARGRPPEGPRVGPASVRTEQSGGLNRGTTDRISTGMAESRQSSRPLDSSLPARPAPGRGTAANDDIRILDSHPRAARPLSGPATSPAPAARGNRSPSRRGGSRAGASTGSQAGKASESGRPRALTSQVNQSMAQAMGRPYEGLQLEAPLTSLSSSLIPLGTRASSEPVKLPPPLPPGPGLDGEAIRALLATPGKLREVAFLTELLKPPLALRPRGRFR